MIKRGSQTNQNAFIYNNCTLPGLDLFIDHWQAPTTVLSWICVDALNATTGNSCCRHCIHRSTFSFGTKSTRSRTADITYSANIKRFELIDHKIWNQYILQSTRQQFTFIYLFWLKPKSVSCCPASGAQPPPAVDTCTPLDHEHPGLLLQHQTHRLPENTRETETKISLGIFLKISNKHKTYLFATMNHFIALTPPWRQFPSQRRCIPMLLQPLKWAPVSLGHNVTDHKVLPCLIQSKGTALNSCPQPFSLSASLPRPIQRRQRNTCKLTK